MRWWRWLAGVAVVIAAIVAVRFVGSDRPGDSTHSSRSDHRASNGGSIEDEAAPSENGATLDAERSLDATTPIPAGATRFRVKFVTADGRPFTTAFVTARPDGAGEPRTITPARGGAALLDLDDGCRSVDFGAHGYVDVHRAIEARDRMRGDLGAIVLVPAAVLDVQIIGAPHRATPWLEIGAWVKAEVHTGWGDVFRGDDAKVATPDGTARARFPLPSDTEVWLDLRGDGVDVHSIPPPLAAGETTWTIDFASFARIRGRVVGVPPSCARGDFVWLQRFDSKSDGLFPGMDARAKLDDEARFEFFAVPDGPFALRLDISGLRESSGARRDAWRTADLPSARELELEPDRELLGLAVGPFEERPGSEGGAHVRFDDPTRSHVTLRDTDDRRSCRGLVAASALREATHVRIDARIDDSRVLDVTALPPPRDGIVTIDLDRFPRSRGRLVVSWNWFASRDWRLYLTASPRSLSDSLGDPPSKRERGLFEETFEELLPGSYDVWGNYKSTIDRRVASGIEIAPDEERRIDVKLPSPVHRVGRITNWSELDPAIRPREIAFENATSSKITDSRFETDVAPPIGRTARFSDNRSEFIDATAPVETDDDGALAVRFPVEELELFVLTVQLPPGERGVACCAGVDAPETVSEFTPLQNAFADESGRITIVRRRGMPLHGWLDGLRAGGEKRVLGWFSSDVPSGTFVPAGRYVEVTNASDGTTATLVLVARPLAGWTPPRIPLCKVIHDLPRRIWIPDGAEFIDVEFPGRAKRRVACATIGSKWSLESE